MRNPIKRKYHAHKQNAKARGVEFLLTFDEWFKIWTDSGRLEQRGVRRGQYVMGRFGDVGPYAVGNVRIVTNSENTKEAWANPETRSRIVNNKELREARRRFALARTDGWQAKSSRSLGKRWKLSPEVLARRSEKRRRLQGARGETRR